MKENIISQKNFNDAKLFLDQVSQLAIQTNENLQIRNQGINNTFNLIDKAGQLFIDSKKIDHENAKLKVELAKIVSDFKLKQGFLQAVFSERSRVIDKHFETIDQGLLEGNDQLILQGLRSVGNFVSTNPLDNFDNFSKVLLDKNAPLDLDF